MTTIQNPQQPVYSEGKPNQVLSMTDVRVKAARYTDGGGRENVLIALFFGKDAQTGKPHMIVMNPDKIKESYVMPSPHIRDGLLRLYDQENAATPELPLGAPGALSVAEVG